MQTSLDKTLFVEWLTEGQHDCDVARTLGATWANNLCGSGNESLADFFDRLLLEYEESLEIYADCTMQADAPQALPLAWLARLVHRLCAPLTFKIEADAEEDIDSALTEKIAEEATSVQAYLRTWRSSGTMVAAPPQNVEDVTHGAVFYTITLPSPSRRRTRGTVG